jgi:hypothetical protein
MVFLTRPDRRAIIIYVSSPCDGMKVDHFIPIVIIIGLIVLFFFPEPETNFLVYAGTALFFLVLTISLIVLRKRDK